MTHTNSYTYVDNVTITSNDVIVTALFPCWCGTIHTDHYLWLQHQCLHDSDLLNFTPNRENRNKGNIKDTDLLMCPDCGKTFGLDGETE